MKFKDYQTAAMSVALDPTFGAALDAKNTDTPWLGIIEEVGELAGKIKRVIRDDGNHLTGSRRDEILSELGDVLWYCVALGIQFKVEWLDGNMHLEEMGRDEPRNPLDIIREMAKNAASLALCVPIVLNTTQAYQHHLINIWLDRLLGGIIEMATWAGSSLLDVGERNIRKLTLRAQRGTLLGSGDGR